MRVIACMLATFAVTASALADGWKEYADPTYAFAVSFPGDPKVETTTYPAPDGQTVSRVFGRQLSILRADGSRSSVALFYYEGRLYQIEGKSLAAGNGTADAIRFQHSLIFTDNGSNARTGARRPRDRGDGGDRGQRRDREVPQLP